MTASAPRIFCCTADESSCPARVAESASVLIKNDRIVRLRKGGGSERPDVALVIDLHGATPLPAFIDARIHGAVGIDVMAASAAGLRRLFFYR